MLLIYATFGTFYLGSEFHPRVTDLVTALYYAMVTMSTVGYGDITPQTTEAKLFAVSIIVLGVAVFATSLTAVIAPLVTRSLVICGEAGLATVNGRRGALLRAYDKATGEDRGAIPMPAPQSGSPITYMLGGAQYLVLAIGGGAYSGELVAYRLPRT